MNKLLSFMLLFSCFLFLESSFAFQHLGQTGKTYTVIEDDMLEIIEEKAKQVDWEKIYDKKNFKKKVFDFQLPNTPSLPGAKQTRIFYPDLSILIPFDIPNQKGIERLQREQGKAQQELAKRFYANPYQLVSYKKEELLYKKGERFNPLKHTKLLQTLVVINANDPKQVDWFRDSKYRKSLQTMLLITDGNWKKTSDLFDKRPIYNLRPEIKTRFKLRFVPSVIRQKGERMEVKEYKVGA